ncbi:gonadotropin-releasing hormone receptor-like [Arctopsyche grandis]|uniref:gonadotropin-releasing hormone receptor-like n=1 Tax=Arctopsyche grandis TaxID=121162 RepID=UPI00406D769B
MAEIEENFVLSIDECIDLGINGSFTALLNGTNVTCLHHAPTLNKSSLVKACVLGALAVLSFVGNLATILSIKRSQRSRRTSRSSCSAIYSLIMQLSVADLLVTVFCLGGEAAWSYTVAWLAGNTACKLFKFMQIFSLYLSTFVLVLVGVDRFVAVRYPMKSLSTARRGTRLLVFVWILSAMLSIPQLIVFHEAKGPFYEEFYQCVTHGYYSYRWQEQLYASVSIFFMFVLPLIVLMITYAATFITISRSEKAFREEVAGGRRPDLNRKRLIHRAKMKSLRISVVIVVAFIVWWTPYYTMMIIFIFLDPDKHISEELQSGIFFFGMSNSLVNPVIYGAFQLWPGRRGRSQGSQREGSMVNHRSTMTQASIMRHNSARIVVDRVPLRMHRNSECIGEEESALMYGDHDQLSRNNSRDIRRHPSVDRVIGSRMITKCKKGIITNHQNNNRIDNVNGLVTRV